MNKEKKIISRWGSPILDDWGFVTIPGWILRNYHRCGVTPLEMMFITHIMSFKYDHAEGKPENAAKPSLATIATYMGRDIKNVRRIKNGLVGKKLLKVIDHPGDCNEYNFAEFTRRCIEYATSEETEQVQKGTPGKNVTPDKNVPPPPPKVSGEDQEGKQEPESNTANGEKPPSPEKEPEPPKPTQDSVGEKKPPTLFDVIALEVFGLEHVNGDGAKVGAFLKNLLKTCLKYNTPEEKAIYLRDLIEMYKWWSQTHFDNAGGQLHKPVHVETICRAMQAYRESPRYKDLRATEALLNGH